MTVPKDGSSDAEKVTYAVRYLGWNVTWNENEVASSRLRRLDCQSLNLSSQLLSGVNPSVSEKLLRKQKHVKSPGGIQKSVPSSSTQGKHLKAAIPMSIRKIVARDLESIMQGSRIRDLPCRPTVDEILVMWTTSSLPSTTPGKFGLKDLLKSYFDKLIPRLLHPQEYRTLLSISEKAGFEVSKGLDGIKLSSTLGAEHFARVLCHLPKVISKSSPQYENHPSLFNVISDLCLFLVKREQEFFQTEKIDRNSSKSTDFSA
eukprot:CAMPEP_0182444790 /NCGR_PEP_ID=MMETSP1172-20130603/3132_1 /TAXON_ID=708627 /ORGANISM="Timspurckia oligopyrenoides, Strain CCMP3278" /LENGTH=259 /DNA_ID=CAMNT_0024640429 /DNA_START=385 /DNA_END=1164 /DNA_ORIENTATION=-